MAYSLSTEILGILPGLLANTATTALIDSHIARADSLIDGKCARRYAVPFATTSTSTPPLIHTLSQDIASFFTYRSKFTGDGANRFAYLDDLMSTAMKTLDEIQQGLIDVVGATGIVISEDASDSKIYSSNQDFTPIFDVDDETSWRVDPDRIDSIRQNR